MIARHCPGDPSPFEIVPESCEGHNSENDNDGDSVLDRDGVWILRLRGPDEDSDGDLIANCYDECKDGKHKECQTRAAAMMCTAQVTAKMVNQLATGHAVSPSNDVTD